MKADDFMKFFSGNYDPSVVAVKMYQRPWEFNITEREIIDTAMGNADVGPKIYTFLPTGKIEEVSKPGIHGYGDQRPSSAIYHPTYILISSWTICETSNTAYLRTIQMIGVIADASNVPNQKLSIKQLFLWLDFILQTKSKLI